MQLNKEAVNIAVASSAIAVIGYGIYKYMANPAEEKPAEEKPEEVKTEVKTEVKAETAQPVAEAAVNPSHRERSYVMIKPDGVQRTKVGQIIAKFEARGFKLVAMKLARPGKERFEEHYADLSKMKFFNGLVEYAASGPVLCMVWEGSDVVKTGRKILGATKPFDSNPGTIRGDACIDVGRNVIHASDSVESANKEIALWFKDSELVTYQPA